MNHTKRHEEFLSLVERFLNESLEVSTFESEFTSLWMRNRDETYAKRATWSQPYDKLLIAEWQHGEISGSEFGQKFADLWGYTDDIDFQNMVNNIHSAFSLFIPSPELPQLEGEVGEKELRQIVKEALAVYQRLTTLSARSFPQGAAA